MTAVVIFGVSAERLVAAALRPSRALEYSDLIEIADLETGSADEGDFEGVAVSPDGKWVAVEIRRASISHGKIESRWKVISLHDSTVIDVGEGGEPIPYFSAAGMMNGNALSQLPRWSRDSRWIYYRATKDGNTQLWRSRRDGQRQEQVTSHASDVLALVWNHDRSKLIYSLGLNHDDVEAKLDDEGNRGFLYDQRFYPAQALTPIFDVSSSGLIPETSNVWIYDVERAISRPANEQEIAIYKEELDRSLMYPTIHDVDPVIQIKGRPYARWARRASNSNLTVWLDDVRRHPGRGIMPPLSVVASRTGSGEDAVTCLAAECTGYFKGLWPIDDGRTVLFLRWADVRDYGSLALFRWTVGSNEVREVMKTDDLIETCTPVSRQLVCSHETATRPKELVVLDTDTGTMSTLYDPNPNFAAINLGEVKAVRWTDRDGVPGFGHLVLPTGYAPGRRYPLIVVQYRSRGFLRGGTGDEYPIHMFATKGFAVLSFHRPDDWNLLQNAESYDEVVQEEWAGMRDRKRVLSVLLAGLDMLEKQGIVDPGRIGITGLSDGANTVAFALVHAPTRFKAAVASNIAFEPIFYHVGGPMVQPELRKYGLPYPESPQGVMAWKSISVALNAESVRTPLLLQVADTELMPTTQAFTALREFGRPVEMYVFPNEHHIKASPLHRLNAYRRGVQWLGFWLCGSEDEDPVDLAQYQRWRALRDQASADSIRSAVEPTGY